MISNYFCAGNPNILGIFDFDYAPSLLMYSYVPIIIISIFLGLLVLIRSRFSKESMFLFGVITSFSLWSLNVMGEWVTVPANLNMFEWQLTALFELPIFIFVTYFVHELLYKDRKHYLFKALILSTFLPIVLLLPTSFNAVSFDVGNCQANLGLLWSYLYVAEISIIVLIGYLTFKKYQLMITRNEKIQTLVIGLGSAVFMIIFWLSNFLGEITKTYEINLIGPIGMVLFIGLVTFLIVRFQTFHVRLFGAQAIVFSLVALTASKLFTAETETGRWTTVATLVFITVFGYFLIKSVKKEIETRERIQRLADQLELAGEAQADTIRFISHQIRGVFTATKGSLSSILEGDYDPISENLKTMIQNLFVIQVNGVESVQAFLSASQLENGNPFTMTETDFIDIATQVCTQLKSKAEKKGLVFDLDIPTDGEYKIMGDKTYLMNAILNVVDNSINYTPTGTVKVSLSKIDNSLLFSVKDTGVGINEEDGKKMFTKYGHGKDSRLVNVNSNGLGLFFTKKVVDGHHGTIWYESEAGKGTTFFVKLALIKN